MTTFIDPLIKNIRFYQRLSQDRHELIKDLQELAGRKIDERKFGEWQELHNIIRKHLDTADAIFEEHGES